MSTRKPALQNTIAAMHAFENCFVGLGDHSADQALIALTAAVHAERRDMNAYDWLMQALPGATLKPALAIGTVGELYRSYTRPAEFDRLKGIKRS